MKHYCLFGMMGVECDWVFLKLVSIRESIPEEEQESELMSWINYYGNTFRYVKMEELSREAEDETV